MSHLIKKNNNNNLLNWRTCKLQYLVILLVYHSDFRLLSLCFRDEKIVCRAIELNEKLQKVLARHDALLSGQFMSAQNQFNGEEAGMSRLPANHYNQDEGEDEEEAEQLFRR